MPKYQQGQSYFKHFVEIEDDQGEPIVPNDKFRENFPSDDVSQADVSNIIRTVLYHSKPWQANMRKIVKFRNK